jgi:putative heme-binding domain-containing protein
MWAQWNLPDDLEIELIADDDLVPDCTNLTCDPHGTVFVSGPGYIGRLIDEDGDGLYERRDTLVQELSHAAHGLTVDDDRLYYVSDNGVWSIPIDDEAANQRAPTLHLAIKTGGEHDAHALRRGPDGFWYLIAGNGTAGMFELQNVSSPMIPRPRAGAIWRISSDWQQREVWAHGFRNAFDFDFLPGGSIVTYDSDGERDVSLPWYRPTRVYQVEPGSDAGWLSRSWKRPNYDPEMPLVLAEFGRGSPTGVLRYAHTRLPSRFHGGVFVLDWTFGRVYFVDTKTHTTELVVAAEGNAGFAATDIALHPDGRLLVTIGGRGSRGGMFALDVRQSDESQSNASDLDQLREIRNLAGWHVGTSLQPRPQSSFVASRIANLRARDVSQVELGELQLALSIMQAAPSESELLGAVTLVYEALGGLGPTRQQDGRQLEQQAAVFDGYRTQLLPQFSLELKSQLTEVFLMGLKQSSASTRLRHELVRGLAVLETPSSEAAMLVAKDMQDTRDPTERLHRLFTLARMSASFSEETVADVLEAMIEIPVDIERLGAKVDSNWTSRLTECLAALRTRISDIDQRLVEHPNFGSSTHLVWTEAMPTPARQAAARKYLAGLQSDSQFSPSVAEFVAGADLEIPRSVIDAWLADETYHVAGWMALLRAPKAEDVAIIQAAANSFNSEIRNLALKALERLEVPFVPKESKETSIQQWLEASAAIQLLEGDPAVGSQLFVARQCSRCHNSATALGPSLSGIAKRFSRTDLLIATVDPSRTISDRYRGYQILTDSGQLVTGMKIYESVDGITLLTADARTMRINADEIVGSKFLTPSLMPTGLLDELSLQQVADLLAYLSSL